MAPEMAGKRLELLREIVLKLSRVAVLWNPQGKTSTLNWKEIQPPARQLGLQLHSLEARSFNDFDKMFRCEFKTDRGPCGKEPATVDISLK